jgi:fatty-acyl-CoA synthase
VPQNPYESFEKTPANYVPLSPLSFLGRASAIYPEYPAVVHGDRRYSWRQVKERCHRLASMLVSVGVERGDTVAVMLPNVPAMFEAHFAVPMTGAVLNALNYRLDAAAIAFILDHGEARVLITDTEFSPVIAAALAKTSRDILVIDYDDPMAGAQAGERLSDHEYEGWIEQGDPDFEWQLPEDEWNAISLNYTSGTTGNPKGVVYHHRGAYLNAVGNALTWGMTQHPVYLWTLPMFHCNGWCFPWTMAAVAGTNVCLRRVEAATIYRAFAENGVTHLCGAPIVMQMILDAKKEERRGFDQTIRMMTAAAPPPAAVLQKMEQAGIEVTHVYGLTETYGPATVCAWHDEWNELAAVQKATLKARQGVPSVPLEGLMVGDAKTLEPVAEDGEAMGEVFFRGNIVMKGYLKNPRATEEAFRGGWFHSGDLGVCHPDHYIQLKDRSKDIIISGGENISSIEVEGVLYKHPAIAAAAVVARPDDKWGETPCAFVEVKPGMELTAEEVIQFCRDNLAHFKCPREVVFGEVPKTSTGKIQKYILRDSVRG